jgi:hypothetical protein
VPTNTLIRSLLCYFQLKTFFPVSYVYNGYKPLFFFFFLIFEGATLALFQPMLVGEGGDQVWQNVSPLTIAH